MGEKMKTGIEYLNRGQFKQCIEIFEKILPQLINHKSKNLHCEVMSHLSIAYLLSGDWEKCQQTCGAMIKVYPHLEQPYANMVICLAYLQKYDQSIRLCDERLRLNNRNWKLYFVKGYVLSRMRKFEQAAENYSIAITKNLFNNPQTYMLQAATLVCLDESEAAIKSIHYAQLAIQEDENKNCAGNYKFEIKNMKAGLKSYQQYARRLKKSQDEQLITKNEREDYQKQLIKIVGKSVDYRSTAFKYFQDRENEEFLTDQANYSEYRGLQIKNSFYVEQSDFWNELLIFDESLKLKINQSAKLRTAKDGISEETLMKNQNQSKLICEWIRQKCSIF